MAANYVLTAAIVGSRLEAGTRIVETVEGIFETVPNGIGFSVTVDKVPGYREALAAEAAREAAELESLFQL